MCEKIGAERVELNGNSVHSRITRQLNTNYGLRFGVFDRYRNLPQIGAFSGELESATENIARLSA